MSNYHFEVKPVRRADGTMAQRAAYITGVQVKDLSGKLHRQNRDDVRFFCISLPEDAPNSYNELQLLVDALESAENRKDARTGREFIGSLPNELNLKENIRIVEWFLYENVLRHNLCAIAAIHEKVNQDDPALNNPHAHIIVSTRTVGPDGFSRRKDREHDKQAYLVHCREEWARYQNDAYRRNGYDIRVSPYSLRDQGIDREPLNHLSRRDYDRELRGERTPTGDLRRAIMAHNAEREQQRELERDRGWELER